MNSFFFDEWVKELDQKFEKENCKVVLIVDNCPAHPIIEDLKVLELELYPPNATSETQPMNQCVICSLKAKYCRKNIEWLIRAVDMKKIFPKTSILDVIQLLHSTWSEVSEATIKNRKVEIFEKSANKAIND